jgi:oligopeptide/dipeptide ABC transporter ATP-binding protein
MTVLLDIRHLSVQIETPSRSVAALSDVSLRIERGEIVGIVGESGAGKTMLARSITGLLPSHSRRAGEVLFDGTDILHAEGEALRRHRGAGAALCFQNPRRALAPLRRVGLQIDDRLDAHVGQRTRPSAVQLLEEVEIRAAARRAQAYPHELSGGMAQRVMIALALACFPQLIVADEPTTGLDVTLTRGILELLQRAAREENRAVLVISHDIAAIAQICDRIVVMYGGIIAEDGPAASVLHTPAHPYSAGLLDSVPDVTGGPRRTLAGVMPQLAQPPAACPFAPRCALAEPACLDGVPATREVGASWTAACIHAGEIVAPADATAETGAAPPATVEPGARVVIEVSDLEVVHGARFGRGGHRALRGVSLAVKAGETLGVVGESGCGKTTLARAMLGLVRPSAGNVRFEGRDISTLSRRTLLGLRRDMQMVAQDPIDALDPRRTVRQTLEDSLRLLRIHGKEGEQLIAAVLDQVALDRSILQSHRHEISGGQAQRVGIARALLMDPDLVVFDEPTSALDVTVQAQILELIREVMLRRQRAYVYVSHDLATVRAVSDRVVVLYLGTIVEEGTAVELFEHPLHPYTRALFAGIPMLRGRSIEGRDVELARDLEDAGAGSGCVLAARCPFVADRCLSEPQALVEVEPGRLAACWRIPELG